YRGLYEQTKATYHRWFGESPPENIWPPTAIRYGGAGAVKRIDTRRFWLVRRPDFASWRGARSTARASSLASGLLIVPVVAVLANPFNLHGREFLELYGTLVVVALATSLAARWILRLMPDANQGLDELQQGDLDPY